MRSDRSGDGNEGSHRKPENEALRKTERDGVVFLRLCRGRGNALDERILGLLARSFAELGNDLKPVVLAGEGRSFCTGLDLSQALELDRPGMARLMRAFEAALKACYLHPAPVVAAVRGHALAGGALLALCCDERVLSAQGCRFGIHGVRLGVSYPQIAIEVLRDSWPRRRVEELLYEGRIFEPVKAHALGLVDELASPEEVEQRAAERARELSSSSAWAYSLTKATLRARVRKRLESRAYAAEDSWLDQWFLPQTRARLLQARDALLGGAGQKPGEIS